MMRVVCALASVSRARQSINKINYVSQIDCLQKYMPLTCLTVARCGSSWIQHGLDAAEVGSASPPDHTFEANANALALAAQLSKLRGKRHAVLDDRFFQRLHRARICCKFRSLVRRGTWLQPPRAIAADSFPLDGGQGRTQGGSRLAQHSFQILHGYARLLTRLLKWHFLQNESGGSALQALERGVSEPGQAKTSQALVNGSWLAIQNAGCASMNASAFNVGRSYRLIVPLSPRPLRLTDLAGVNSRNQCSQGLSLAVEQHS